MLINFKGLYCHMQCEKTRFVPEKGYYHIYIVEENPTILQYYTNCASEIEE